MPRAYADLEKDEEDPSSSASIESSAKDANAPAPPCHRAEYRSDVDGLRAVAVLAVIAYHIDHRMLPAGFTGVDVFFVISGFVVSGSLLRERSPSTGASLLGFYTRRVKRLSPALLLCVLCTSVATAVLLDPQVGVDDYFVSGQFALLGWNNNHFAARGSGYMDEGPEGLQYNPFTHTWSLAVEEQFYFAFPLLVVIAYGSRVSALARRLGALSAHVRPLALLLVTIIFSFAFSLELTGRKQQLAFYLIPSRFWQLMAGAALFEAQAASSQEVGGSMTLQQAGDDERRQQGRPARSLLLQRGGPACA